MKLAHLSDVHFGRIASPGVVPALLGELNAGDFDLVVVSGDLTQRARQHQFQAAADMLGAIEAPVLVVPGNHDVPAWYRPWTRTRAPLRRYKRYITPNLQPTFEQDGLAVAGFNTAHGLTFKGGRVRPRDLAAVETFFARQPETAFKVLVSHHPLYRLPTAPTREVARFSKPVLDLIKRRQVRLLLWGHLHRSHVEAFTLPGSSHRVVAACAGTATSSRGREAGPDPRVNQYNHIEIGQGHFSIEERRYDPDAKGYLSARTTTFDYLQATPKSP